MHTRLATEEDGAKAYAAVDAIVAAEAPTWRRRTGKKIVEYAFRHEGKDSAIAALRARLGVTCVLYAGDDVTDEDALASLSVTDVGIHVGTGETAAQVSVATPQAMAEALESLAVGRAASSAEARPAGIDSTHA